MASKLNIDNYYDKCLSKIKELEYPPSFDTVVFSKITEECKNGL